MESFDSMLDAFESVGYKVNRVKKELAVVFNNGVDTYNMFDTFVSGSAQVNDFNYCVRDNLPELKNKADKDNLIDTDKELYIAVGDYDSFDKFRKDLYELPYDFTKKDENIYSKRQ